LAGWAKVLACGELSFVVKRIFGDRIRLLFGGWHLGGGKNARSVASKSSLAGFAHEFEIRNSTHEPNPTGLNSKIAAVNRFVLMRKRRLERFWRRAHL
jgi:hypothetical protein